ncbi:MAG: DUF6273 domain-containing protein, partial [Oscillospiraceae bacterium]|nr:DUF6273 domain-containing protein [Oscillospiraceae bacterium]
TRAEFAAVAVKVYENLGNTTAIPVVNNPFTDTKDVEVLKAYNVGITSGTAADKFSPDVLLNREQCATMLTRVFKRVTLAGWTLDTDENFTLTYTKPALFADDAKISDWAKDSVYFMAANGIINGTGNNNFSPKAVTDAEKANNYASATREQALAIAVRMVENLGGTTTSGGQPTGNTNTTPTTPNNPTAATGEAAKLILAGETRAIPFGGYEWRVLAVENGKALLITEDVFENRAFRDGLQRGSVPIPGDVSTYYTWDVSELRAYMNGEFLNKFSAEEQAQIALTSLAAPTNPNYPDVYPGEATTDKIFCLSIDEAEKYFSSNYDRLPRETQQKKTNSLWWLRSPGNAIFFAACVMPGTASSEYFDPKINGAIDYSGSNGVEVGIRPALWLNLH